MDYFDYYWIYILNVKQGNADELLQNFVFNMNDVLDKNVPLNKFSKCKLKLNTNPWITEAFQTLNFINNVFFNRYIK